MRCISIVSYTIDNHTLYHNNLFYRNNQYVGELRLAMFMTYNSNDPQESCDDTETPDDGDGRRAH